MAMKRLLPTAIVLLLLQATPAAARDLQKGWEAAQRGDYAAALHEYRPLAEQGLVRAQYNLGFMYRESQGLPQDYSEAMRWFRLAAEQGLAPAQYNLGVMYGEGQGVPQDDILAHTWFNLAAAQGEEGASANRDTIAERLSPDQIAEAHRLAREWQPTSDP
ncbi:MAG: tetratricopeptide repeat protein [Dehalococcoidia bacterium]